MAATFQRLSGGRLLLNVVTGGESARAARATATSSTRTSATPAAASSCRSYAALWAGEPSTSTGEHIQVEGAQLAAAARPGPADLLRRLLAGRRAGRRPARRRLPHLGRAAGRGRREDRADPRAGRGRGPRAALRHPPARHHPRHLRGGVGRGRPAARRHRRRDDRAACRRACAQSESEGQRRMLALHGGSRDDLEIYPNLWAGVGLVRGGAGTALVGSHEEVADRIEEYPDLGIDEFILSGYPHLEEAYSVRRGRAADARRARPVDQPGAREPPGRGRPSAPPAAAVMRPRVGRVRDPPRATRRSDALDPVRCAGPSARSPAAWSPWPPRSTGSRSASWRARSRR